MDMLSTINALVDNNEIEKIGNMERESKFALPAFTKLQSFSEYF